MFTAHFLSRETRHLPEINGSWPQNNAACASCLGPIISNPSRWDRLNQQLTTRSSKSFSTK